MEGQLGIENLKNVILAGVGIGSKMAHALEDGKFSGLDVLSLVPEIGSIKRAIDSLPKAKQEYLDLQPGEREDLHKFIQEKLELPNDKVEQIVEESLNLVLSAGNLICLLAG